MLRDKYKSVIAAFLDIDPNRIFLYWKGRVALYALLKAMGVKHGDEVILPAFTCVVVPNAIKYLGAKPVYVDIRPDTYNMDLTKIENHISDHTRVIISQNTFGLSSDVEEIVEIARKYSLYTIEDCTHGFGGTYKGKPNGSYCDAAFFSTQWNKPFSTGLGGFLNLNNTSLIEKVCEIEKFKVKPTILENMTLASLILFREYLINRYTYYSFVSLYRFLSRKNLIIGSTQGSEFSELNEPHRFFKDMSLIQIITGIGRLKKLSAVNILRKKNATDYTKFLSSSSRNFVDRKFFDNHLFLKYPLRVRNRSQFLALAKKSNVVLGDWFNSPLYPVQGSLDKWDYNPNEYEHSLKASESLVNLPTDIKDNTSVIRFLQDNLDLIE